MAVQKEHALRDSNILYNALKTATINVDNSLKVKQSLNHTKNELNTKTLQLKAISAEANARYQEIHEKEIYLNTMKKELFDKKQELLKEKRDKRKLKVQLEAFKSQILDDDNPATNSILADGFFRTAGAGFRIPYGVYTIDK